MFSQTLDQIAAFVGRRVARRTLDAHCRLVTTAGEHEFVADDGSIVTLFRLDGLRSMASDAELSAIVEGLRIGLSGFFSDAGHTLQFWLGHSPDLARAQVERSMDQLDRTTRDAGLDVDDIVEERRRMLPRRLSGERSFMALWSRPTLLQKQESKDAQREVREKLKGAPAAADAQMPGVESNALLIRHRSVANAILRTFAEHGVVVGMMEVHDAMGAMKSVVDPAYGASESTWKGVLPGDVVRSRMAERPQEVKGIDISNVLLPLISRQLITEHAEVESPTAFAYGDHVFSCFDLTVPPEVIVPFDGLVRRALENDERISWRVSMFLDSGGFQGQVYKEQIARIFAFKGLMTANTRIRDAFDRLKDHDGDGDTVMRWRVSFAVWAPTAERDRLVSRVSALRRAVERWGNAQTDNLIGDPVQGVMSSALGITAASTGPVASASLTDVLAMSPISRPASPWASGAMLLRTEDGKPWSYQPGSSLQSAWAEIFVGTPGSGKSVLMNSINLAVALSRQTGRSDRDEGMLPRISIIDVGRSAEGLVQLMRDALPIGRRHEAVFHRLRMDDRYAVNPFDTQLGLRRPLMHERGYLINLLSLVCTPEGETKPYDGISQLASAAIDAAYAEFDDGANPKPYAPGEVRAVDEAIAAHGIEIDEKSSWWELTDALAERGGWHEASLAQRHAVPVLADLVMVSNHQNVAEPFSSMTNERGEPVLKAFQRMLTAATRDYPIIAKATRFDVASARVVVFDLADVVEKVGRLAEKKTAIMYMMARQAVTHDFWLDLDELHSLPCAPVFRERLVRMAEANKQMPKRLCFDEYHLTGGLGIRDQVVQDVRVGRKQGVQIALASQLIEDFDESLQELATNVWFCNVPTASAVSRICETYDLPDTAKAAMGRLNGPIQGVGAPVLAMTKLKTGTYVQRVINELGPVELWALSTTAEDTALRTMLYERLGPKEARRRLARRFPSGSAKDMVERRLVELEDRAVNVTDKERADVIGALADDLVREAV